MTLRAIAKQLKVSKDTVAKDLEAMAEGWREKQYKNIDGILKRVQDTYDHLRDRAIRMEDEEPRGSAEILLKVLIGERQLYGLDAPSKSKVETKTIEVTQAQNADEAMAMRDALVRMRETANPN